MVRTIDDARDLIRALLSLDDSRLILRNDDRRAFASGLKKIVRDRDQPKLFAWLMEVFSYQGISDAIAADYIERHGNASWQAIDWRLKATGKLCPKLRSFATYQGCGYRKGIWTCNNPALLSGCPVPQLPLRKGQLNQLAFSLYLFIRDLAGGDLVGFIDDLMRAPESHHPGDDFGAVRDRLVAELGKVYAVGPKLASMALASLLISAGRSKANWLKLGRTFVVVDSLVHNFLHRTGILKAYRQGHAYGPACYGSRGCAAVLQDLARAIDLKAIEPGVPRHHPRLLQKAIWHFCAQSGLDICNGHQIDDRRSCQRTDCPLGGLCARLRLKSQAKRKAKRRGKARARLVGLKSRSPGRRWYPPVSLPQAFQQGTLDSLCGLYAVINAIRLVHRPFGPFGRERGRTLFSELIELTDDRWGLANIIVDGYDDDQFRILLYHGVKLARDLTGRRYSRSYKALVELKRRQGIAHLHRFTAHPGTAVIVGIWGRMDHWSVLTGASRQRLLFYDSDALKYLPIARCSLNHSCKNGGEILHWLRVSGVVQCRE